MAKPTDKLELVQNILLFRLTQIYGDFVGYPNIQKIDYLGEEQKNYDGLSDSWNDFFRPDDWEEKLNKFFEFRLKHLKNKYSK